MARHVALVGEAGRGGGIGQRRARGDRGSRQGQPAHRAVADGARAERGPELARDCPAVDPADPLERVCPRRLRRMRGQVFPHRRDRLQVDRRGGLCVSSRGRERIGDGRSCLRPPELVGRLVDVCEEGGQGGCRRSRILHGLVDEGQPPASERRLHDPRLDVEDAVPEPLRRAREPVVNLVGMQKMQLPGEAQPPRSAVAEELHPARRDPHRVGVVAVRLERAAAEERLDALDPCAARPDPDRVAAHPARSFKTAGVNGR
jgi:hypothetical protein